MALQTLVVMEEGRARGAWWMCGTRLVLMALSLAALFIVHVVPWRALRQESADSKRLEQLAHRLTEIEARLASVHPREFEIDAGTGLPGSSSQRLEMFTVGTSADSGCYELADSKLSNAYDMASSSCNGQTCPSCFITPTVHSSDITLSIANCSSHMSGYGTRTRSRIGVWNYVFINRHPTFELTVNDGVNRYTVLPTSHLKARCDSASGINRLFIGL